MPTTFNNNTLTVSGKFSFSETTLETFSFINNSEITFDLSGIEFSNPKNQILKIAFSLYSGDKTILSKPIQTKRSFIDSNKTGWNIFTKKVSIPVDAASNEITIVVYDYSSKFATIKIPYTLITKSISELGGEFDLVSANLRNDFLVSYVVRQKSTDSLIVFQETP